MTDRPLVTCLGEVLVDLLPVTEDSRTVGFRMHPGGSLFNVAMATARLGTRVALVTRTGADFFGRYLRRQIEAEGIDSRWLGEAPALTALGIVAFEGGEPLFTFYGEGTADTLVTVDDLGDDLFAATSILHLGSISLLRGTTPAAAVAAAERLHGRALLSLDPNLRPGLVRDEGAYRATLDRLVALVDLVKVSAADLSWLAPGRDAAAVADELLDRGPALVVVTRGGAGVLALRRAPGGLERLELPPFSVDVVDTVGAGDSFQGGLLTRLADTGTLSRAALEALPVVELRDALEFAAAVAALNCTRPGADPPRRADVEAFLAAPARPG